MIAKPDIVDTRSSSTQTSGQAVLKAMANAGCEPTPENYAIWYHHLEGDMPELSKEIEKVKKTGKFDAKASDRLYDHYLKPKSEQEEATESINDAMGKLMKMVGTFSTDAAAYNEKLGEQTDDLSSKIEGDEALEGLLGEVMGQLKEIKANSDSFGEQMRESQREITELRENLEKATSEARIDGLTSLNNRRAFDEHIAEQSNIAEEEHQDLCLLLMDIDHFKKFNDTWGHQIGDEVLKVVGGALKRTVRGQDIVARYGGEEFAVLLPETPTNGAHIVAENIRKLIAANRLKRKNSTEDLGQITISIGVTRYRVGDENESIENFIERADNALYSAKENGRNRVALEL